MGVFSRFRDIVNSNINAMLDKAEDPRKMIRLMIQEMEETLVEIKASCARTMAEGAKSRRELDAVDKAAARWEERAAMAVAKGRDDLAREALLEKRALSARAESLAEEAARLDALAEAGREDIAALEDKLHSAREKQRLLLQRHARASARIKARGEVRKADAADAMLRFDAFEHRIDRLEAEADLAGPHRAPSLEERFDALEQDDVLEAELAALKARASGAPAKDPDAPKAAPKAADKGGKAK